MKKQISAVILGAALAAPALVLAAGDELADKYFSKGNPALTPQEKAALAIAKQWDASAGVKPAVGPNGAVIFVYGAQQPSLVCAVLNFCDLALQAGEQVNSIELGDKVRWSVDPALSGAGPSEVVHLIIKPKDVGLETSLLVTTTRRAYFLRLRSHRVENMSQVAFAYPEDATVKLEAIRRREVNEQQVRQEKTIPQTGEYLGNLSFDYDLAGSAAWKPVRVYNDGRKTIIQMPKAMAQTEAPALLVVRKEGSAFKDDETVMVNYRLQGDRYIVDAVFDKAILIAGVGDGQDRVTITRRK